MATVKEIETEATLIPRVKLPWVAVIYSPHLEGRDLSSFRIRAGLSTVQRYPALRHFQLPPEPPPGWKPGIALESKALSLKPGTNLGVDAAIWELLLKAELEKIQRGEVATLTKLIEQSVIEAISPDIDAGGSPSYRHFSPLLAKKLILNTNHEDWLDDWGQFETRPDILKEMANTRLTIISSRQKAAV